MYTPLGIKTDYSLLKSLIKVKDLVLYAKNNGYTTLGILDNNLNSSYTFYNACKNASIKPIIGLSTEVDNYTLYLYPKTRKGLINLNKYTKDKVSNILTIADLEKYVEDVIIVLPFESIKLYEVVEKIFDIVYLSYKNSSEKTNELLITENVVYISEINSLSVNASKYVNYLYMIDKGLKLGDIELVDYKDNVLSMKDEDTDKFTDLINIEFETGVRHIPHYGDDNLNSEEYLINLAYKGLTKRMGGVIPPKYKERLDYELKVIADMGFTDYFLIVFDYVRFSIKNNIMVGAGRGSAVGSLVAYSLGITCLDPLKYDLLFERFLNPNRITMPDIDIDFEDERREEVINYVRNLYGSDRVAKIVSYATMTAKDVLRSVAKINNVDDLTLSSLLKKINPKDDLKKNKTNEIDELLNRNSLLKKVYEEAYYLEGIKKHITITAAGVVISSVPLTDVIPLTSSSGEFLTGYDKDELEGLGILKMDFLSIRNLTIMSDVLKDIESSTGKKFNINSIPLDDKEVFSLFYKADTVGVFQFESVGMKNFLKKLKPECFDDLVMALAIYRPGPMGSIDEYLARKNNHAPIKYVDDSLMNILKPTYGILIYQEQVMEILRKMGNFSYAEADIIRRAISKKKMSVMEEARVKFINNAINLGYKEESAKNVYDLIVKFADFGFNKSHSVAYAFIAYQMAYLKVHFKEFYYINLLNTNIGGETKTKEYIDEAKHAGITVLKPDINLSNIKYAKEVDGIRLPLRVIKGVGIVAGNKIIELRGDKPFTDFYDFIARCYGFNVNKKVLESLIMAGVFDAYGYNRATLIKNINSAITYGELIREIDSSLVNKPLMEKYPEYSEIELMNAELELYGYYVSTHPASKYPKCFKLINIEKYFDKFVETVVLIENIKTIKTKTNKDMAFIKASDETFLGEFTCFESVMPSVKFLKKGDLVKVKGRVEKRLDKFSVIVQSIEKI